MLLPTWEACSKEALELCLFEKIRPILIKCGWYQIILESRDRQAKMWLWGRYIHLSWKPAPFLPIWKSKGGNHRYIHFLSFFHFFVYFIQLRALTEESIWFGRDHFISWKNHSCKFRIVISAVHRCPTEFDWNPRFTDVLVGRR